MIPSRRKRIPLTVDSAVVKSYTTGQDIGSRSAQVEVGLPCKELSHPGLLVEGGLDAAVNRLLC
ncbi:hypothetical protein N7453_005611 [Penicillium expansum]|nr:hypothetical protein N7453_005611 [Penicillium expansum]